MADDVSGREPDEIERRDFLNLGWKVLGFGLVVEAGWTTYDLLAPPKNEAFGGIVDAGAVSDYLDEGAVQYFLDGRFYVTMHDGGLRALYQKCPHLGCRVPFCDSSGRFECPCHGSVYNVVGEYLAGPAPRGLDRFPIRISGDRVLVDTSTVVQGPPRDELTGPSDASGPSCVGGSEGASAAAAGERSDVAAPEPDAPL